MDALAQNSEASPSSSYLSDNVREMLRTRYEDVFELSADGQTYVKPSSLLGVPVAKQGEGTSYWQSSWDSLDAYIAREQDEEDLKTRAVAIYHLDESNRKAKKEQKLRCDNMSKQKKIREVFGGDQRPHPNQLVAKRYLPRNGMCEQETMYRIGCKVSDLCILANQGLLRMDPWDFYRWRIGRALMERRRGLIPGTQDKAAIKSIVTKLGGINGSDPLFRDAVIHAAILDGRGGSYGSKKERGEYAVAGEVMLEAAEPVRRKNIASRRKSPVRVRAASTETARSPSKNNASVANLNAAREKARAGRRARLAQQPTVWTGVNGFRAANLAMRKKRADGSGSETAKNDSSDSDSGHLKSSRF